MPYDRDIHHRRSIRLQGYDYAGEGAYFVTICCKNRECLFGEVIDGAMELNEAGNMVATVWKDLPARFDNMEFNEFVVMPNHIHGIIVLVCGGTSAARPSRHLAAQGDHKDRPYGTLPHTLGRIVQAFKSITTHQYIKGVRCSAWRPFPGKLWQRNYWEHIIRDESEWATIREYIGNNPARWAEDQLNPALVD